ncbi:DMT family transporter, partial [Streptomyces caeruleatus]
VVGITVSISKIGALVTFVLVVLGQIITSAIIDHFGLLGMEINPINLLKITSILIILVGVFLLIKPNADDIGTDSSEIQSKA